MKKIKFKLIKKITNISICVATTFIFASFVGLGIKHTSNINNENLTVLNQLRNGEQQVFPTDIPQVINLVGEDTYFNQKSPSPGENKHRFNEIYPSQHFGENWLGVTKTNSNDFQFQFATGENKVEVDKALKTLVVNHAIQNLYINENENINADRYINDDTYLKVNKYYIDNYTGIIVVDISLYMYYGANGFLVDCVNKNDAPYQETVTFKGFKSARQTLISNSINIKKIGSTPITQTNILDFAKPEKIPDLLNTYEKNGIEYGIDLNPNSWSPAQILHNTKAESKNSSVIAYPGLKQLRTQIGVKNYFKDMYLDPETFVLYEKPSTTQFREKIGVFTFEPSSSINDEKSFVANYPTTKATTFIREGVYQIDPTLRDKKPSEIDPAEIKEKMFKDKNALIENPHIVVGNDGRQILTDWEIVTTKDEIQQSGPDNIIANDIEGTLTLKIRLTGDYLYQGEVVSVPKDVPPNPTNIKGYERLYTITLTGLNKIQPTSVNSVIDFKALQDKLTEAGQQPIGLAKASAYIKNFDSENVLRDQLLKSATQYGWGFKNIPISSVDGQPDNDTFFNNNNLKFEIHHREQNNCDYLGKPNDINGTLELTIKIKNYYNETNGTLVQSGSNENEWLVLRTKIVNFDKTAIDDLLYLNDSELGHTIKSYGDATLANKFAKEAINYDEFTINQWKKIIYDLAIETNDKLNNPDYINYDYRNNIQFNIAKGDDSVEDDIEKSWNDPLTSNTQGNLNLHFSITGLKDKTDGIEITTPSQVSILFRDFSQVIPTQMQETVHLTFNIGKEKYATDISDVKIVGQDDQQEHNIRVNRLKQVLLQKTSSGMSENINKLFVGDGNPSIKSPGIPNAIYNDLILQMDGGNPIPENEVMAKFDKYFVIDKIVPNGLYYQDGQLNATIGIKLYYDQNGNLIDATEPNSKLPIKYTNVVFSGFLKSNKTTIKPQVKLEDRQNELASDYSSEVDFKEFFVSEMQKNFDANKENPFFYNLPKLFFDNELETKPISFQNIVCDNTKGTIRATVSLSNTYFDEQNEYVSRNVIRVTSFKITISGFKKVQPTLINPIINVNDLVDPSGGGVSTDLIKWSKKIDRNPTNQVDETLLKEIIKANLQQIVENPYIPEAQDAPQSGPEYFVISSPNMDYKTGQITFDLTLNYYFSDIGAFPFPSKNQNNANQSDNNFASVTIIGFNQVPDEGTNKIDETINIKQFDQQLANISPVQMVSEPNNKKKLKDSIVNNQNFLHALFRNLPSTFVGDTHETIDYIANNLEITNISQSQLSVVDSIVVDFKLTNIFVPNNGTITIGEKNFSKEITGFVESKDTNFISDKIWDVPPDWLDNVKIAYWGDPNNPNDFEQIKNKLSKIMNTDEFRKKFCTNLVYDENNNVETRFCFKDKPYDNWQINPREGTIKLHTYLSPFYRPDGQIDRGESKQIVVTLRNFPKQQPTQPNNTIIYTDSLEKTDSLNPIAPASNQSSDLVDDPIFGKDLVFGYIWGINLSLVGDSQEAKKEVEKKITEVLNKQDGLIDKMFLNNTADVSANLNPNNYKTKITGIDIKSINDFNGSLKFTVQCENFFNENGLWTEKVPSQNKQSNDPNNQFNNIEFTIIQKNKSIPTNLSKTEATVDETLKVYSKYQSQGIINFDKNMKASEFYKHISNKNNLGEFQSFLESTTVINNELFGISAKNPSQIKSTSGDYLQGREVKPLTLTIGDKKTTSDYNELLSNISYDDAEGSLSIKVTYDNVYSEPSETNNKDIIMGINISSLASALSHRKPVEMTIKIIGFKKDNSTNDTITTIAIVASSLGLILIIGLLIVFIVLKTRSL